MNWEWLQWGFIGFLFLWTWTHQAILNIVRRQIAGHTDIMDNLIKMIQEMTGWKPKE